MSSWLSAADAGPSSEGAIVWVRPARTADLELPPDTLPALRRLAREGLSFPRFQARDPGEVLEALRRLRRPLGSGYREIGGAGGATPSSGGLERLIEKLGKPPPVSEAEEKALEKLRKASGQGAEGTKRGPGGGPDEPTAENGAGQARAALDALSAGARLVVVSGDGARAFNGELQVLREHLTAGAGRPRAALLVVLVSEEGRAALVVGGSGRGGGRVFNQSADAEDLTALLARFLALDVTVDGGTSWFPPSGLGGAAGGSRT